MYEMLDDPKRQLREDDVRFCPLSSTRLQCSRLSSRFPAFLRSPRWRGCCSSAAEWRTSTPRTSTWSGRGTTGNRSVLSHTLDHSLAPAACTACGVRSSWSWPGRMREQSTPAVCITPASRTQATRMLTTTSTLKVAKPHVRSSTHQMSSV